MKKYTKVLFEGCDTELRFCTNSRYFSSSNLTYKILLLSAAIEKSVIQYYRILNMASGYLNSSEDPGFVVMYASRSEEYSKTLGRKSRRFIKHKNFIENLLANFTLSESSNNLSVVEELLKNYNPWNYNGSFGNYAVKEGGKGESTQPKVSSELFIIAAKSFLYDKNGKLNSLFLQLIKDEKAKKESFWALKSNIEKSDLRHNFFKDINLSIENDEFLFLIDRLYKSKITSVEADAFFSSIRRKYTREEIKKKLIAVSIAYFYSQLGQTILDTKDFIELELLTDIGSLNRGEVFNSIIQKSTPLSLKWNQLPTSTTRIKDFISAHLGKENNAVVLFDSLNRNIKYISVYPMMALMSYYISIYNLSFKLMGFWGAYEVSSKTIITKFINGSWEPWVNFTPDFKKLSKAEIFLSFYYLKKLGLLKSDGEVNEETVFYSVFNEYLLSAKNNIKDFKDAYLEYRRKFRLSSLKDVCNIERERRSCINGSCTNSPIVKDIERPTVLISDVKNFMTSSYLGPITSGSSTSGELAYFNNIFGSAVTKTKDNLENIYKIYLPQINFIKTIYNTLALSEIGDGRIDTLISEIEQDIKTAVNAINDDVLFSNQCLFMFAEIESLQHYQVVLREKKRLEDLHDSITKMKQGVVSLEALNAELSGSIKGIMLFDKIEKNGDYVIHKSDSALRFMEYLSEINPGVKVGMDTYEYDNIYKSKQKTLVNYYADKQKWISEVVKATFNANEGSFKWFDETIGIKLFNERFNTVLVVSGINGFLGIEDKVSLVEERKRLLELLHINDEKSEDVVLNLLERKTKFPDEDFRDIISDEKNKIYNLHSYTLIKMKAKGEYFDDVVSIHNTLNSTGTLLFPVDNYLYKSFSAVNTPLLKSRIQRKNLFVEEAENDLRNSSPFIIKYQMPNVTVDYTNDSTFEGKAISSDDKQKWEAEFCNIVRQTGQRLVTKEEAGCN